MKNTYKRLKKQTYSVEHRLIMEQSIGRKLTRDEIVHHINHNKRDNRIENLQLLTNRKEHNQLHRTNFCPKGHEFTPENTGIKYNKNKMPYRRCKTCHRQTANL